MKIDSYVRNCVKCISLRITCNGLDIFLYDHNPINNNYANEICDMIDKV